MLLWSKSFLKYLSLNSLFLCLEKTDPTRPRVFQLIHRKPSERGYIHPTLWYVVISAVVREEHPVSSENVQKQGEQLAVVRCWEHQEETRVWKIRICQED